MSRIVVAMIGAFVVMSVFGALPVALGVGPFALLPGVIFIAYAALLHAGEEAAITASLVGLVIDARVGAPLGLNALAGVLTLVMSRPTLPFLPGRGTLGSSLFVGIFSAVHVVVVVLLLVVFGGRQLRLEWTTALLAGVGNALCAVVLFPLYAWLLVLLRLEERNAPMQERLSRRTRQNPLGSGLRKRGAR
jgi:hypothetical protein